MNKAYSRVNWSNDTSKKTFINDTNLNVMDKGIDVLDDRIIDLDGRLLELEGYEEEAKESAENADVSEANAKTSENNAKASETKAKEYMEKAFAGTPDGYDALVSKVDSLDIKKTTDSTLHNSKHGGARLTKMVGNTVQNGTPTPSTPQPMYHTSDVVEMIQGTLANGVIQSATNRVNSKNYIPCKSGDVIDITTEELSSTIVLFYYDDNNTYLSYISGKDYNLNATVPSGATKFKFVVGQETYITPDTVGKITLTINGKYVNGIREHGKNLFNAYGTQGTSYGSAIVSENGAKISVNGTYYVSIPIELESNTPYIVSWGVESYTATKQVNFRYEDGTLQTFQMTASQNSLHAEFTPTKNVSAIYLYCGIGTSGTTVYTDVMIRKADILDDTYEPYQETTAYFLTEKPMMADSVLFHENGLFKVEHKSCEEVLDGANIETAAIQVKEGLFFVNINNPILADTSQITKHNVQSTHYATEIYQDIYNRSVDYGICMRPNEAYSMLAIRDKDAITLSDMTAKLQAEPITVKYPLATPYIEVLDTESQLALNSLKTFDNVTYLGVDSRTKPKEIEVEYGTSQVGAYTLQSLNNTEANAVRLNELAVAMVSLGSEV